MKRLSQSVLAVLLVAPCGCQPLMRATPAMDGQHGDRFQTSNLAGGSGPAFDWLRQVDDGNQHLQLDSPPGASNSLLTGGNDSHAVVGSDLYLISAVATTTSTQSRLAKYDTAGNLTWLQSLGTGSAAGVAADESGIYVITNGFPAVGVASLRKYDASGTLIWTRSVLSGSSDRLVSVAVRGGFVYVVGQINPNGPQGFQELDGFVRQYGVDGSEGWTRTFDIHNYFFPPDSTHLEDAPNAIGIDALGNVYVCGDTYGSDESLDAGPNAFLLKYSSSGNLAWVRQVGTGGSDGFQDLTVTADGIYVGGYAGDPIEPGPIARGAYLRRYNFDGDFIWHQSLAQLSQNDRISAVAGNSSGIYVALTTGGTWPGETNAGGRDGLVIRFDPVGNLQGACQFGTSGNDHAFGLDAATSGVFQTWGNDTPFPSPNTLFLGRLATGSQASISQLVSDIEGLVDSGNLPTAQGNALSTNLDAALVELKDKQTEKGIRLLTAFIFKVQLFVKKGDLSESDGIVLVDSAEQLIALVSTAP